MAKIRKAVLAAAGFGTRFLPQTKAMPKEMLPLVDKPIIQYVVEELVDAGVEDIIIVTGYSKRPIEDHFDTPSQDLAAYLRASGKDQLLTQIESISNLANFAYIRQKGPVGNATPVLNAEHLLGSEPFIYAFADDFVLATPSRFKQLIDVHAQFGGSVLTCARAQSKEDYTRYGFVGGVPVGDGVVEVESIIEKPGSKQNSPSDLATVSGYILESTIFSYLHKQRTELKPGEEFVQQIAMQEMIRDGHKFYGCEIKNGKFYDAGNKLEYLKTVVDFGLTHKDIAEDLRRYLRSLDL